jgi:hypothetical protein
LNGAFDLNDYFVGGTMAGGVVNIPGSANVGITPQSYTITAGGDSVTVGNSVKVSTFLVANGAAIDGLAAGGGGNPFVNVLRPGVSVSSVQALVGAAGGAQAGATPGPVTGPVGWSITFANVASSYQQTLRVRNASKIAESNGPSLSAAGLTAEIDAAGNYTLTADDGFGGPVVVTFRSGSAAGGLDGASVLASGEISVGANYAGNDETKVVDGSSLAQVMYDAVDVGGAEVTVAVDCTPAAAGINVALAALDSGLANNELAYVQHIAAPAGTTRLSLTYKPPSGTLIPLVQVVGGTVTFSNLKVFRAPAVAQMSVGANSVDMTTQGGAAEDGTFSGANNAAALVGSSPNAAPGTVNLGAGTVLLGEAGTDNDNISLLAAYAGPANIAAQVQLTGSAGRGDIVITALDANFGAATSIGQFRLVSGSQIVSCAGQLLAPSPMVLVTVQGVGGGQDGIVADNMACSQVQDLDAYVDLDLY